jgi:hypothetical protein
MIHEKISYSELSRRAGVDRAVITHWLDRERDAETIKCDPPAGAARHMRFVWGDHERIIEFIQYHKMRRRWKERQ